MESLFIKIDSGLAFYSKRDLLQTEINMLSMIKRLRNYSALRSLELQKKMLLRNKIKQFSIVAGVMKKSLPKADEKEIEETKTMESSDFKTKMKKHELEDELKEIQRKLLKLSE